jgi:hypothetical protein
LENRRKIQRHKNDTPWNSLYLLQANKLFLLEQLCECKIHCDVKNVIVCFYIISSSVSKEGSVAPRTGFFYNFNKKEVVVRKWNPEIEDVVNNCNFIL